MEPFIHPHDTDLQLRSGFQFLVIEVGETELLTLEELVLADQVFAQVEVEKVPVVPFRIVGKGYDELGLIIPGKITRSLYHLVEGRSRNELSQGDVELVLEIDLQKEPATGQVSRRKHLGVDPGSGFLFDQYRVVRASTQGKIKIVQGDLLQISRRNGFEEGVGLTDLDNHPGRGLQCVYAYKGINDQSRRFGGGLDLYHILARGCQWCDRDQ